MHDPWTRLVRAVPALAAGLALGACANPAGGLSGTDSDGAFGGLRVSWEVPRPTFSDGKPPARQYLVEIEASSSDAAFDQALGVGESLTLDGTAFVGPSVVAADFEVQQVVVDGRLRLRNETGLGVDLLAGLGFARLDLEAHQFGASASLDEQGFGPRLGTGLFWELPPRLRFFVEGTWHADLLGGGEVADVQVFDVGLNLRLTAAFELVLTWRRMAWEQERDGAESDLDLAAQGPRLTLQLRL